MSTTVPGIRERLYISGVTFQNGPSSIDISFEVAETRQRARSGKMFTHRAAPYAGCAERITKATITLGWGMMSGADIDASNEAIAFGGPLDICPWLRFPDSFWVLSGSPYSGVLQRRDALAVLSYPDLPINASTKYAHSGDIQGGGALSISLGSIDSEFRTPWTASGTSSGNRVFVHYVPVFRAHVSEGQPTFTGHQQGQTLKFIED